jgi:hypothetical protein
MPKVSDISNYRPVNEIDYIVLTSGAEIDGEDLYSGVYVSKNKTGSYDPDQLMMKFAEGGKLSDKAKYIPKYRIEKVVFKDKSEVESNALLNGFWVYLTDREKKLVEAYERQLSESKKTNQVKNPKIYHVVVRRGQLDPYTQYNDKPYTLKQAENAVERLKKSGKYEDVMIDLLPFKEGGMIDLFEDYENIPPSVQAIIYKYENEENEYSTLEKMLKEVEAEGYTFDYGLDAEPYGLRKIGVELKDVKGFEDFAKGGKVKFDKESGEHQLLFFEQKEPNHFFFPQGLIYVWLYDVPNAAEKLDSGEFNYVFYPFTSRYGAWQKGYVPPLRKMWHKSYQKDKKGAEHLLGVIKAIINEDKDKLYIDMMSVNPKMKKRGIMSYMLKELRDKYNLSQDQIEFIDLTEEGKKFEATKKYSMGGESNFSSNGEFEIDQNFTFRKGGKTPEHNQKLDMKYQSKEDWERNYKRRRRAKQHPRQHGGEVHTAEGVLQLYGLQSPQQLVDKIDQLEEDNTELAVQLIEYKRRMNELIQELHLQLTK